MIAARLAGGNLFLPFLGGGFLGGGFFWWGILGALGAARSTRIFFEGICGGGILFFVGGVVGCVLDCKCWKKLKND